MMLGLVDVKRMQKIQGRYMALVIQEAGTTTISACTARATTSVECEENDADATVGVDPFKVK